MSILKNKLVILSTLILIGSLVILLVFWQKDQQTKYFILNNSFEEIDLNDPVYAANEKVGFISDVSASKNYPGNYVITLQMDEEFSIPDKSTANLIENDEVGSYVEICIKASKGYLHPGDTFFLTVRQLVPKTDIKAEEVDLPEISDGKILVYKVQLLSSKNKIALNSEKFYGIENIEEEFVGGYYKYYFGEKYTLKEAKLLRKNIVYKGINDAFIVAFLNGERISLKQAAVYEN